MHTGADAVLDETSAQEDVRGARTLACTCTPRRFFAHALTVHSLAQVFAQVADVVRGALEGCNGTIFAYGQTGTGKTYTMLGTTARSACGRSRKP